MLFKICNRCKEQKLINDFHKNKKKHDGLQGTCKECTKELGKIARENKRKYSAGEHVIAKATVIPTLTRDMLANMELNLGGTYEIIQKDKKTTTKFRGILVNQTDRFITLKHKFGYLESFLKADFATGERKLKEVV